MTNVRDTWYRLADGTQADPKDVSTGKDGVMRHKTGVPVAMRAPGVPHTIGVDAVDNKNVQAAKVGEPLADDESPKPAPRAREAARADEPAPAPLLAPAAKELKPARSTGKSYKTRESKAR